MVATSFGFSAAKAEKVNRLTRIINSDLMCQG